MNQILGLIGLFFYFGENFFVRQLVSFGVVRPILPHPPPSANRISHTALLDANCANLLITLLRSILAILVLRNHRERALRRRSRRAMAERRRGLIEAEMDTLKKETFWGRDTSVGEEVGTQSNRSRPLCSICLDRFGTGDTVWILPCDERHIFHGDCIKSWLRKNNSCPLCQKNVVESRELLDE